MSDEPFMSDGTPMNAADPRLPNWPPPDDEPIGMGRARQYIAWIREHAPPLIAEAEAMLAEPYPTGEPAVLREAQLREVGMPLTNFLGTPGP
jgi:hypothetical protein